MNPYKHFDSTAPSSSLLTTLICSVTIYAQNQRQAPCHTLNRICGRNELGAERSSLNKNDAC